MSIVCVESNIIILPGLPFFSGTNAAIYKIIYKYTFQFSLFGAIECDNTSSQCKGSDVSLADVEYKVIVLVV